jgi:hypothetical protein
MRYVVMVAYAPGQWDMADDATRQQFFDDHHAFERFVDEHGRRIESAALADAELATTIRRDEAGEPVVTDGPFAELAEQVGGYYDVELPDLDTAIAAAKLLPRQYTVEIRPTVKIDGYESV